MASRCEFCQEFGVKVSDDGRLVLLWGAEEDPQALSLEISAILAQEILERQAKSCLNISENSS